MADQDDFTIDAAIAAAMGFSGFGTQPGKKRKFDSNDAFVDPSASASAANTVTARPTQALPSQPAATSSKSTAPWYGSAHYDPTRYASQANNGPLYETTPQQYGSTQYTSQAKIAISGATSSNTTAPPKVLNSTLMAFASSINGNDKASLQALRDGVRNAYGDTVYFQPSFLEDPWSGLRTG